MLSLQVRVAVLALLPLLIWGTYRALSAERAQLARTPVEIGVEHRGSAAVAITHSVGGRTHLVDIGNEGQGEIHVSLPDTWTRGEVRGTPLASLVADAPSFGFRRWTIPPGATVTYRTPHDWRAVTIHNPTAELLRLKITTVDLTRDEADTEVYLLNQNRLDLSL